MVAAPVPVASGRSQGRPQYPETRHTSSAPSSPAILAASGSIPSPIHEKPDPIASGRRSSRRQHALFGPYRLGRTLGEGEFGKVKLAIHLETKKEVAIKLIKKENIEQPSRRAKLMREISILQVNQAHMTLLNSFSLMYALFSIYRPLTIRLSSRFSKLSKLVITSA